MNNFLRLHLIFFVLFLLLSSGASKEIKTKKDFERSFEHSKVFERAFIKTDPGTLFFYAEKDTLLIQTIKTNYSKIDQTKTCSGMPTIYLYPPLSCEIDTLRYIHLALKRGWEIKVADSTIYYDFEFNPLPGKPIYYIGPLEDIKD